MQLDGVWCGGVGQRVLERGRTGVDATVGRRLMGVMKTRPGGNPGGAWLWRMKGRWDLARLRLWRKLIEGKNVLAAWVYRQSRLEFEQGKDQHR